MSTKNIEGLVLSRVNFGEADRILTIFSQEEGKIRVLAKGSRKIKSKMAPHIEPFTFGKYFLAEGKTFYILAGAESLNQNSKVLSDLELYKDACYIAELLNLTLHDNDPAQELYEVTKEILDVFPELGIEQRIAVTHFFEYKLLESNGYRPNFRVCKGCGQKLGGELKYRGNFEGVYCKNCRHDGKEVSLETVKVLNFYAQNDLKDTLRIKNIEKYNSEIKEVIIPFLYDILPKNPKAKQL